MIPSIDEIDIAEKRVFIRADLDVPLTSKGEIGDDSKILLALKTISYAVEQKAKVIVGSHFGRPGGKFNPKYSLETIGGKISALLDRRIYFPDNSVGSAVKKITVDMLPGEVMLLENLDFHKKELSNGTDYAKKLAETADVYVNDAFSVSNQYRASVTALPEYFGKVSIGLDFKRELEGLKKLRAPERPFVVILGGSNVNSKIGLMESLMDTADVFLVGGALANTFLNAKGIGTALSEVDKSCLYRAKMLISGSASRNIKFILPQDVIAAEGNLRNHGTSYIISRESIPGSSKIMDVGIKTSKEIRAQIKGAKTVLWSGPLGIIEKPEFKKASYEVAKALTDSDSFTVALGGHTVSLLSAMEITESRGWNEKGIDFISHGGDACLEYIQSGRLPAITALKKQI